MQSKHSFIAVLPYDLLVERTGCDPVVFNCKDVRVRAYWPFCDEAPGLRQIRSLPTERIPFGPKALPDQPQLLLMTATTIEPKAARLANALRLDILSDNAPEGKELLTLAEAILSSMLRAIRYISCQWWVGYAHRECEGIVRSYFKSDVDGNIVDRSTSVHVRVESRFGCEQTLTTAMFRQALPALESVIFVQRHRDVLFDAVYSFIARDDIERAMIDGVLASELAIEGAIGRLALTRDKPFVAMRRVLKGGDFLANLRVHVPTLLKRSYFDEHPGEFGLLTQMWAARGDLAHGRLKDGVTSYRVPERKDAYAMLKSAAHLIDWLEQAVPAT